MRLVDYNEIRKLFDEEYKRTAQLIRNGETHLNNLAEGYVGADKVIRNLPDVDAVVVVMCKDCAHAVEHKYSPAFFKCDGCSFLRGRLVSSTFWCKCGERRQTE